MTSDEVVFSLDLKFRAPVIRRLVVSLVFSLLLYVAGRPFISVLPIVAAVAVGSAVTFVWRGRFKTILAHDGIRICGYFNHFVPWSDVARFDVVRYGAPRSMAEEGLPRDNRPGRLILSPPSRFGPGGRVARLATVTVVRVNGRRTLLRAPWVTAWQFDPDFEHKVAVLEQWRQEHTVPQGFSTG